ncbi:thermonuclease family protein [Staphylococcus xylosus]|uniref:thermonuclease family protein n=1 Tax=Staphylococcus xylosus TaxID=1288 RepID=UPI002DB8E6ED|nr:thermonuclease family protein [Staphylococcus xylosus]MEB6229074.1 thermonuclease family protein [Staphylococcus xylosus]
MDIFLFLLWFFISIAFIVMLVITIVKTIRKRNVRGSLISTMVLFIVGFIAFICIGIFSINDSEINETKNSSHAEKSENQSKDKLAKEESKSKNNEKQKNENLEKKEQHKEKGNNAKEEKKDVEKKEKETHKPKPGTTDRIPVELSSKVDGDTAKFIYDGNVQSFRFLLIDTPETKHPRLGKQPFGQEASDRTAELLNNANEIEVEFDVGQKQDKYNRYLAYIYVDGEMLNNILVREGLAKVAYVYPPNTRYLTKLENSQEAAKSEKIGIWSLDSAFETEQKKESNSQTQNSVNSKSNDSTSTTESSNNSVEKDSTTDNSSTSTPSQRSESFPNCTALRQVYPNGVPLGHPAYEAKHDRDKDDYACEVN